MNAPVTMPARHEHEAISAFQPDAANGQTEITAGKDTGANPNPGKEKTMNKTMIAAVVTAFATVGGAFVANAGECPAASVLSTPATFEGDHSQSAGVTDTVLAVNHLADFYPEYAGRDQRIRMLTIEPGGVVAMHSHEDRPALIYIITGEIVEHRTTCAEPIVHKAGEVAAELGGLAHWWKNESNDTVTLISSDLPRAAEPTHTM